MVAPFIATGAAVMFLQEIITFFQLIPGWRDGLWRGIKDFNPWKQDQARPEAAREANHTDGEGIALEGQQVHGILDAGQVV
jgi:hypothetical protein